LPNIPASFNVLLSNLRGLALDVELNKEQVKEVIPKKRSEASKDLAE
jgi:hypothetical protein